VVLQNISSLAVRTSSSSSCWGRWTWSGSEPENSSVSLVQEQAPRRDGIHGASAVEVGILEPELQVQGGTFR